MSVWVQVVLVFPCPTGISFSVGQRFYSLVSCFCGDLVCRVCSLVILAVLSGYVMGVEWWVLLAWLWTGICVVLCPCRC